MSPILPLKLRRYLAVVAGAGATAFVGLISSDAAAILDAPRLFWVFVLLAVLGELLPIQVPRRDSEITTSTTFIYAALLAFGPAHAVLAAVFASGLSDALRRRGAWRTSFNVGQFTLAWASAGLALEMAGGGLQIDAASTFSVAALPPIVLAGAVFFWVNNALVGVASALVDNDRIGPHLWADLRFQAATAAVLTGLAPIVVVAADVSLSLLPLLLLPLAAIYLGGWQAALNDHQALHDALTGLPNRALLRVRAELAIAAAERDEGLVQVLVIDLDGFKQVNDTLGHQAGDSLLREIAGRLREALPESLVARLGGDEFAVLLDGQVGVSAAERLEGALEEAFELDDATVRIRASVGIATWPADGRDVDTLLEQADAGMYRAKHSHGASRSDLDPHERRAPAAPRDVAEDLRHALRDGALEVVFQPKVRVTDRRLVGAEALVRWDHPKHGMLSPGQFIPIAEASGLIQALDRFVLDRALDHRRALAARGIELGMAVNLSPGSLLDPELPGLVIAMLERRDTPPGALTLELTESLEVGDSDVAVGTLRELTDHGVRLAIDDFGTGYASLARLTSLPVSEVKIDRQFVRGLPGDHQGRAVVAAVVDLANRLGIAVVAEGVEHDAALTFLRETGCPVAQGYLLGRPMDAASLAAQALSGVRADLAMIA